MAAQYSVPDPTTPGKMFMNYQGLASYLSSGGQPCTHTVPASHISPPSSSHRLTSLCFFSSNQATTIGWSTPTMTTTPSPTPAAPWRRTAAARTATPSSSPGTPVACHQPSSASSVRSRRTSAWPESSSPSCSPAPAKEKEGVKKAEKREETESVHVRVMMCRMNGRMQRVKKKNYNKIEKRKSIRWQRILCPSIVCAMKMSLFLWRSSEWKIK